MKVYVGLQTEGTVHHGKECEVASQTASEVGKQRR